MTASNGQIDLFAKLGKKKEAADAPVAAATPPTPPTQEQIAAEPALPINPPMPEGTPPAPPVGTVEAKPAKTKRGRPAGSKNKLEQQELQPDVVTSAPEVAEIKTFDEAGFDVAWGELGTAVKKFLKAVA